MTNKPHFTHSRKAVKAVIVKSGKLLILQRNPQLKIEDNWDLPGGLINKDETMENALKREVREEIGAEIKILEKGDIWSFVRTYDGEIVTAQNYICELVDPDVKIKLSQEHLGYKWIEPTAIVNYEVKDDSIRKLILKRFDWL